MPIAHRIARASAALALATLPAAAQQLPPEERGTVTTTVVVGEGWYQVPGGPIRRDAAPLARALELAAPGCIVDVEGSQPALSIGFESRQPQVSMGRGGTPLQPVIVRGRDGARLLASPEDTLKIAQQYPLGPIRFVGLTIEGSPRAAVIFYEPGADRVHRGFEFLDCTIDGGFDHAKGEGQKSKWGVLAHGIADFVFAGRDGRAVVRDICHEHAFYIHQPAGDVTIENVDATRLGRTFIQVVAREREGPPGFGRIVVRDCKVSDTGLASRDGYKGGTAFTFAGRLADCSMLVERCTYRAGFDPALRGLTKPGEPYGTSAFVAWDGHEGAPNGLLVLRDNDFEMAPGCGDRPLVSIGACKSVSIEGENRFVAGGFAVALAIDPAGADGRLENLPNGQVHVARTTVVRGDVTLAGRTVSLDDLAPTTRPAPR